MPIFHDVVQNSPEWFYLRLGIPTASDMKKIITPKTAELSAQSVKYVNQLLWEWVSGVPIQDDEEEDLYESKWMRIGKELESEAAETFEFQMEGLTLAKAGFITTDDGLLGASPDRIVSRGIAPIGGLEIKSASGPIQIGRLLAGAEAFAAEHKPQVQAQIMIAEWDADYMISYHQKLPPIILRANRDDTYIGKMQTACRQFIDQMLEKRLRLEREFGPFKRVEFKPAKREDGLAALGITMEDVEAIINDK